MIPLIASSLSTIIFLTVVLYDQSQGQTVSPKGSVATDNEICTNIAQDILNRGGNAVDAAIAAAFCTGVVDSRSSGLGGGHFAIIYLKRYKTCISIDAREEAPGSAFETMYQQNPNASQRGWLSIGVPGELHGLWTAYKNYGGRLPWKALLEPAINICRYGFKVSQDLENSMKVKLAIPANLPAVNYLINPETGSHYKYGEIMTLPALGDTLEKLANAEDPVQMFYCGSIADGIALEFEANGGIITKRDMCLYKAKYQSPQRSVVYTNLKDGNTICAPPPPSSAAVTSAILNILNGFNMEALNINNQQDLINFYHTYIEASRFAYAGRNRLGDPDFVPTAMRDATLMASPEFASFIKNRMTGTSQKVDYYGIENFVKSDHGTAHISVMDSEGNAVSLTSTINFYFGAGSRSQSTGIIWNNEMDDFSSPGSANYFGYAPSPSNFIRPGKRPLSSMSPLIVFDKVGGDPRLVIGGSGGSRIISIVAQVAARVLSLNQSLSDAIAAPRFHNQLLPDETYYEPEHPKEIVDMLDKLGHRMNKNKNQFSPISTSVVAIYRTRNNNVFAANDPRRQKRMN